MSHKPIILDLEQGSSEWHAYRDTRIGASDVPIILGVSPWSTPRKLWERKQHLTAPTPVNDAMKRGTELEPVIRAQAELKFAVALEPFVIQHPHHEFLFASLDGWDRDANIVHEFKAPNQTVHAMAQNGEIPEYYLLQVQVQMMVADSQQAYYHTWYEGELATVPVLPPDKKTCTRIIKACTKFYEQLQTFVEPDAVAGDFIEHNDDEWLKLAKELIQKQQDAESALQRCDEIKLRLQELAEGQNAIGGGVRVCKYMRKGTVQYKLIPELQDVDLDQYRTEAKEHWRISVERDRAI